MELIKPFAALRPAPTFTEEVIAPPYDIISSDEAKIFAHNKPHNILHVSKAEIDFDDGADPHDPTTHAHAKINLEKLLRDDVLIEDAQPSYYLYRLSSKEHTQTGIICAVSVQAYKDNLVRKHELTHADKEIDRSKLMIATKVQTGPVILTYKNDAALDDIIDVVSQTRPTTEVSDHNGVVHQLWQVTDQNTIDQITNLVDEIGMLYIADGHHRCAASVRAGEVLKTPESQYVLAALFPDNQLQIVGDTTVEEVIKVADANEIMPPKSTYFEPKLADGLVLMKLY